jgi:chromosome partitioning protein
VIGSIAVYMKIGITNLKGGVGKTTLSINLAVCFAHMGYKVCIVDTDTNQTSFKWYGARDESLPEVLVLGATDAKALNKAVDSLHTSHDIVIIDGTPSLSEMTTRIILASDFLIVPIRPGAHDFRTMDEFFSRYDQVKEIKGNIPAYFLLNEYTERINVHKTVRETLAEHYGLPLLNTVVKSRAAYVESSLMGTGVFEHSDNLAKLEMVNLTDEILKLADSFSLIQQ